MKIASIVIATALVSGYAHSQTTNLGGGWPGVGGIPTLTVQAGVMVQGQTLHATLANARPDSIAMFVAGLSLAYLPIFGGILVPSPDSYVAVQTDADGSASFDLSWQFSAGTPVYIQFVTVDDAADGGWSFSNALDVRGIECCFDDLDGGRQFAPVSLLHGVNTGGFDLAVPKPLAAGASVECVWAFMEQGVLVDIPTGPDVMSTSFGAASADGVIRASIAYGLDTGSAQSVPFSYTLPGAGIYQLVVWVGDQGQMTYGPIAVPAAGWLSTYTIPIIVIEPEVVVYVPTRNGLSSGAAFPYCISMPQSVSHDRYFTIGGTGGIAAPQASAVIFAGQNSVWLSAFCHYPAGRLVVTAQDSDGSAVGGDNVTDPSVEVYCSAELAPVSALTTLGGGTPVDAKYTGPYYGEMTPRTAVGDHGAGTECKHAGGADPNPTGMPNFKLCGACKIPSLITGDDRKICKGKIPTNDYPLVSEPLCGPAQKWRQTNPLSQNGPGGHFEPDPSKHCVVTEVVENVAIYKLDGSGTEECAFVGLSLGWFFVGTEGVSKYCCYYSNTESDAQQVPVRRCTTVQ